MRILIGVDNSSFSQAAVESVAQRRWEPGTEVKVVSAVDMHFEHGFDQAAQGENHYNTARQAIDRAIATLSASPNQFELAGDIVEGSPKQVLLDEADAWRADLIVVGSHGRRGLDRFLLGSVSQAVALHARCSVEIVRMPLRQAVQV
jgi:nucleotide-binding universal stress UspA family protein